MSGIYIYSEKPTLAAELVGFGKATGKPTYVLVFSRDDISLLDQCGADGMLCIDGDTDLIENNSKGIAGLLKQRGAEAVLVGATARGRDFAARIAGFLDSAMSSDVSTLEISDTNVSATRTMYGGSVVETVSLPFPAVATVPAGRFDAICGSVPIEHIEIAVDDRTKLVSSSLVAKEGVDLSAARSIVAFGMGVEKLEDVSMVQDLADQLGAELACTRGIAEERHWIPIEQYVGLSGVSVAPDLYLTVGISGQVQHVVGMRDSKTIVAIDKNPQAPIFKSCDYGIVGDLYKIVPLLTEEIKRLK